MTDELVSYVLKNKKKIKKVFNYTMCDEMFLQTIVYNSSFKDKLYDKDYDDSCLGNQRYIDWKRGTPYTFRNEDFEELINSNCLFARKFNEKIDCKIIDRLLEYVNKEKMGIEKKR
ncbi:hypothetical protein [Anaerobutyricum soehngenii]|uniref:hypothetical protein n=1 Tax=Anaerobutyricum soehngenii TaxID=105843 RepID=UPI0032BF73F4